MEQKPPTKKARDKAAVKRRSPAACSALRAYRVTHPDMGGAAGIYAATSPGKARYMAMKGAHDAGFRHVTMPSLVVRRAQPYDAVVRQMPVGYGWDEDFARQILEQND